MKKIYFFILATFLFLPVALLSQNAIVGSGFTDGWQNTNFEYFEAGAGTSYQRTENANGTGDQYFRIGIDWGGTVKQITVTPGSDTEVTPENEISLNTSSTANGAMYMDISSTSDKYIFKTRDAGTVPSGDLIIFRVQGDVRAISSVSQSPSTATVYPGQQVTVTATLDNILNTGQGAYLRYSTDGWTTSTFVEMAYVSDNDYSATIDASVNIPAASFSYYVFTSGDGLSIVHANADWYTINLENNSGANYSYSVQGGWTTAADGNWASAASWAANAVPPTTESMGSVSIAHDVTLNQDAKVSSVTISALKTLTSEASGNRTLTIESNGTFTNSGIFTANDGSVVFLGVGTVAETVSFNNVTINGGVDFGASSTVGGVLTLKANSWVNTNCPTYGGSSTLKYNTGGNFMIADEWNNTPQNVTISGLGTDVHIDENGKTISGNLLVENNASFTIDAAKDLTIDGNLTINSAKDNKAAGVFTLKSDDTGTGSLIINGICTDEIKVERFITADQDGIWHFLSSPVIDQPIVGAGNFIEFPGNIGDPNVDFYKFDETEADAPWINIKNAETGTLNTNFETTFEEGRGYLWGYKGSNLTRTFTGVPYMVGFFAALSYTHDGRQGWNMFGNPYQSAFEWNHTNNSFSGIDSSYYYIYNENANGGGGGYEYYYAWNKPSTENANGYIPAMQAFFVRTLSAGATITISPFSRTHNSQDFLKSELQNEDLLTFKIQGASYFSKNQIYLLDGSSTDADGNDAYMLFSLTNEVPHFYCFTDNEKLAANCVPFPDEDYSLPMGMRIGVAGTYTITAEDIQEFDNTISVILEDSETGAEIDLRVEGSYTFEVAEPGINNSRFVLHLKNTVGINELNSDSEIAVSLVNRELRVYNLEAGNYNIRILDIMGRVVMAGKMSSENTVQLPGGVKQGTYVVQVFNASTHLCKKLVIR